MSSMMMIISMKTISMMNPISLAISILVISLFSTMVMFKIIMSSWMSFVTILTFSSGMMTLFMYTASLSSNEKNKSKKSFFMLWMSVIMMITMTTPLKNMNIKKETMKMFSNNVMMIMMGIILILTMMTISIHGHHPNQTASTSF